MRRYKISQSVVADKPGWYALYYVNKQWREVTYTNNPEEPVRFTHAKDAMNMARIHSEDRKEK